MTKEREERLAKLEELRKQKGEICSEIIKLEKEEKQLERYTPLVGYPDNGYLYITLHNKVISDVFTYTTDDRKQVDGLFKDYNIWKPDQKTEVALQTLCEMKIDLYKKMQLKLKLCPNFKPILENGVYHYCVLGKSLDGKYVPMDILESNLINEPTFPDMETAQKACDMIEDGF
ncbi:MAG: hypothetical protein Q4F95_02350 [Oscillospiraceae bacterium]|nr:hypothetical protein [Oscillospiraceae bacterium]